MDDYVVVILEFRSDGKGKSQRISINEVEIEQMLKKFDMTLRFARTAEEFIEDL